MYVCVCKCVTNKEIEEHIKEGCDTIEKIQEACQAGTDCGICEEQIKNILEDMIDD